MIARRGRRNKHPARAGASQAAYLTLAKVDLAADREQAARFR